MKERDVIDAYCLWMTGQGWTCTEQVEYCDVRATRDSEVVYAEAKGDTGPNAGLDVDTMYGQLLRRMTDPTARYAVVVPEGRALAAALRVSEPVRRRLGIDVYAVASDGSVRVVTASRGETA